MTSKLNIQKNTTKSVSRLDKWSTIVNYDSKVILVQFQFRIVKKPNSVTWAVCFKLLPLTILIQLYVVCQWHYLLALNNCPYLGISKTRVKIIICFNLILSSMMLYQIKNSLRKAKNSFRPVVSLFFEKLTKFKHKTIKL